MIHKKFNNCTLFIHFISMLLHFRTIGNQHYQAEFDLTITVKECKTKMAPICGFDPAKMRLIYKARLLDDKLTLAACKLDTHGFIVLHGVPLAPPNAVVEPPPSPKPIVSSPLAGPTTEPLPSIPTNLGRPDPPAFGAKIENLCAMGFSSGDCAAALRAAVGNVDRAADFLLSGHIPAAPQFLPVDEPTASDLDGDEVEEEFGDDEDDDDEAAQLRRATRFRDFLIRDPAALRQFLAEMAQENPAVKIVIRDDPAAFLASLGWNPNDFDLTGLGKMTPYEQVMAGFADNEKVAIHNLERLGLDAMTIIQVFVACEKHEDLARQCLESML
jgi:UV excision repair protein RAD23